MKKLTELDALDLIADTKVELCKLNYKTEKLQDLLKKLELILNERKEEEEQRRKQVLVRSYRTINKQENNSESKRKPYPLSDWDKAIINALEEHSKIMVSADLLEKIIPVAKENGFFVNLQHAKIKLNQCLVKLANRRSDIIKLHHRGRGFAYGLPHWLDGNQLKREYQY